MCGEKHFSYNYEKKLKPLVHMLLIYTDTHTVLYQWVSR